MVLLLAEDEPIIGDLLAEALTESGYKVVSVQNGTDALREIESDTARFRAIITDIRLGSGPNGWEIARRARELAPHIPIVYMSGDSAHDWASMGVPGSIVLAKPFAPAELITAVASLAIHADMHAPPTPDSPS